MYKKFFKRLIDVVAGVGFIIVFAWLYVLLAVLVKTKLGSPVLFSQPRPGKDGRVFYMYKFRSMTNERDEKGALLPDSDRMTPFGKKLRESSLDELPSIFNIVKGDMSIFGPRPQLVRDMVFFDENIMKRQSVRPGLTGLAQVNGRNNIDWDERFKYDLEYVDDITFVGDAKLFFKTIKKVFKKEDIETEGMATSEDYADYLLRLNRITQEEYDEGQKKAKEILADNG